MNLFGKILTLIILILSLIFSAVAVMVGMNYKDFKSQAATLQLELKNAQAENDALNQAKLDMEMEIKREKVARARALAELQSRQERIQKQLDQKENELAVEKQKSIEALSQSKESLARTAELDKQIADLKIENQNYAVAIAKKVQDLTALQNQTYQLQGTLNQKEERMEQLIGRLATASRVMKAHNLDSESLTAHIEPMISAEIKSVADDLVVFNVGRDDGLRVGHQFDIYRGPRYMGQVEVTRMEGGNRVTARVIKEVAKIRVSDVVKTRNEVAAATTTTER